ncbi:MAG: FAD-dependent oxidoreductase, partial [Jannaschia sp.]
MDRFDVIVIGGGMMGAPCARHLAEAGHSVALIAAPEPSDRTTSGGPFGSHFDAARITRRVASDADWSLASRRSIARYRDLEARSGRTIFRESGAVMAGPEVGPMSDVTQRFLSIAAALDDPPERLDTEAVRARLGIALPAGSLASFEAAQGGWIDPRAMRDAQQVLAVTAGAALFAQAAVARNGGVVTLADGTRISGGHVVVATGPHAASDGFLPARPRMKVWARTIAFARLSEAERLRLADLPSLIWVPEGWDYDLYMLPPVRYPDGRWYLKIGGEVDSARIQSADEMAAWFHGAGDAAVGARLLEEMRRVLPGLDVAAAHTEPCAVAWTETGYPYIDAAGDGVTVLC